MYFYSYTESIVGKKSLNDQCAELWGLNKATPLEEIHACFLRFVLGTDKNTSAPTL